MKDSFEKTDKVALEGKAVLTDADLELIAGGRAVPFLIPEASVLDMMTYIRRKCEERGDSEEEIIRIIQSYRGYLDSIK